MYLLLAEGRSFVLVYLHVHIARFRHYQRFNPLPIPIEIRNGRLSLCICICMSFDSDYTCLDPLPIYIYVEIRVGHLSFYACIHVFGCRLSTPQPSANSCWDQDKACIKVMFSIGHVWSKRTCKHACTPMRSKQHFSLMILYQTSKPHIQSNAPQTEKENNQIEERRQISTSRNNT